MLGEIAFQAIDQAQERVEKVALDMWQHPEGPYQEVKAQQWIAYCLREYGFEVELGTGGVPTAVSGRWGSGHPVIGFLGELDALPGMSQKAVPYPEPAEPGAYGQACGHNLIATGHLGAVIGLKAEMEAKGLPGTIIYYGCPAEEQLTGKAFMARGGAFDELDVAMHFHPGKANMVNYGYSVALNSVKFHFKGRTAHAGGDPWNGRSALDAVELTNIGANYLREHVRPEVRIHYVITDGGMAPNIVPDKATTFYFVRAPYREMVTETYDRLVKIAEGAALMTGTELTVEYLGGCYDNRANHVIGDLLVSCMNECPPIVWTEEEKQLAHQLNAFTYEQYQAETKHWGLPEDAELFSGPALAETNDSGGSSDVGDVFHIVPGAMFNTACYALGSLGHSWQVVVCSGTSIGLKGMKLAAQTMALAGLKLLTDPSLLARAQEEFKTFMGDSHYQCPITPEMVVPGSK